jgi:hypothetical protein
MDLNKMLSELRSYRAAIDQAILALEGLASGARRGPGRPRKWITSVANRNETSSCLERCHRRADYGLDVRELMIPAEVYEQGNLARSRPFQAALRVG